jgi:uncharacterized protein
VSVMAGRIVAGALLLAFVAMGAARAGPLESGIAAYNRHDYATAATLLLPLATQGDARAQTYIGYMYANGRGVAQSYVEAARWYFQASEQGVPVAQFMLGLLFDKGQGVAQDYVEAYMWLDLAVARGSPRERQYWQRIRDAVASKLTLVQLTAAQRLAVEWQAGWHRPPPVIPLGQPY